MFSDLHCHSTASDGTLAPDELVKRAHFKGIELLSLTDHDTIDGLALARKTAQNKLKFINGIELSCLWGGSTIHILGYNFSDDCMPLKIACDNLRSLRWQRAELIAHRLEKIGVKDALIGAQKYQAEDTHNAPARLHFAKYLVELGKVKNVQHAFDKYLANGKIGDVKQFWPSLAVTMNLLHKSEALISLAHPYQYNFSATKLRSLIMEFTDLGGQAIEIVNGLQNINQIKELANLSLEFNLLASWGSDFHRLDNWSDLGLYQHHSYDVPSLWRKF